MRKLILLSVVWLLLVGLMVAPSAAKKRKNELHKSLMYNVGGLMICKPPTMEDDSTYCIMLPPGSILMVPLHPRDPLHES